MFREFKVGDLFDVHPTKAYKLNNSGLLSSAGQTPVIVNSSQNNGIGGYSELEPTEDPGILTFSDTTTGPNTLFYQNQPFIGYPHVQGIYPKNFKFNDLMALFMVATLRAALGQRRWDYSNKLNRAIVIEMQIQLPVKPGTDELNYTQDDIDWDYMESTIRELEESTIRELDAYLKETGLDDYHLTDAEHALLDREPMFCAFSVGELFDVVGRGTRITKQNRIPGNVPLVTAGKENQGVAEYIQENKELFRGPVFTIDMFGNAFARDYDFYADDNIIVFGREDTSINRYLYVVSMLGHLSNVYGYGNQFRLNSIENTVIKLPVKPGTDSSNYTQDDIDWDYMESYNRVMEKRVIADVVDYKNEVIALTEECVSDN